MIAPLLPRLALAAVVLTTAAASLHPQEPGAPFERITFPGGPIDVPPGQLEIVADLYRQEGRPRAPLVVLLHGKRSSRGEYRQVAPRLNALGYDALAVDLRSGGRVNRVRNWTARQLLVHGVETEFLDVVPDIETVLRHAREHLTDGPVLLLGSAASATLALDAARAHPELVDGVLAFSPGDYFSHAGKPADWARLLAAEVVCPVLVTGTRSAAEELEAVFGALPEEHKTLYLPTAGGVHGAHALWPDAKGGEGYWDALAGFLERHFPPQKEDDD